MKANCWAFYVVLACCTDMATLSLTLPLPSLFLLQRCEHCQRTGATVGCCLSACLSNYHFMCARLCQCTFQEDKKVFCQKHVDLLDGTVKGGVGVGAGEFPGGGVGNGGISINAAFKRSRLGAFHRFRLAFESWRSELGFLQGVQSAKRVARVCVCVYTGDTIMNKRCLKLSLCLPSRRSSPKMGLTSYGGSMSTLRESASRGNLWWAWSRIPST